MDGDPSQEDRIRLTGRLFFQLGGRRIKLRSPFCILFVQVMTKPVADLTCFYGESMGKNGQFDGQISDYKQLRL
jgi:hypothetical protein